MRLFVVLSCLVAATMAAGLPEDTLGFVYRVWDDCNNKADLDLTSCLKVKLATAVSRAARMNDLTVFDGVTFVRTAPVDATPEPSEEAVESALPRSADARDDTLSALILERATQFFQTHSLSVKVPEFAERSLSAGDARGKIKKIAPLLLLPLLKAGLLIPLAVVALFLLAGKALIISKLALLLSGIIGLKKLFSGHGHVETAYVSSGASHGWGRSEEAQNLAYSAHAN
ncbi:uncharacterized protein LOC135946462 [Cloeon dipterum]|uniref:uncharacterized protein LOC135946462 n=1 Tax=Cloeon dipterum TaxID=197152 RepID=UPI003220463F